MGKKEKRRRREIGKGKERKLQWLGFLFSSFLSSFPFLFSFPFHLSSSFSFSFFLFLFFFSFSFLSFLLSLFSFLLQSPFVKSLSSTMSFAMRRLANLANKKPKVKAEDLILKWKVVRGDKVFFFPFKFFADSRNSPKILEREL